MDGQMSIFDILPDYEQKFCFDDDINQIVKMLDDICTPNKAITKIKKEWSIWSHVSQYGYRLDYDLTLKEKLTEDFFNKLDKVEKYAKAKYIDLSPYGLIYYNNPKPLIGYLSIYSTFLDERKKIKKDTTSPQLRFA